MVEVFCFGVQLGVINRLYDSVAEDGHRSVWSKEFVGSSPPDCWVDPVPGGGCDK